MPQWDNDRPSVIMNSFPYERINGFSYYSTSLFFFFHFNNNALLSYFCDCVTRVTLINYLYLSWVKEDWQNYSSRRRYVTTYILWYNILYNIYSL